MKSLIVDEGLYQSKVAYVEDKKLIDLFVEDKKEEKTQNNIYRGIVENVLLGMEAAFIDVGLNRNGYLQMRSNESIKKGQEILVQVKKEAIGDKGVKLTKELSIPGRYLVLMPTINNVSISNKIDDKKEKKRLADIVNSIRPDDIGLIIRTEAKGKEVIEIEDDLKSLLNIWENINKEKILGLGTKLLYKDLDNSLKVIRDIFNEEFDEIVVNNKKTYDEIKNLLKNINPLFISKVKYFDEGIDIFDFYGIKKDLKKALSKKVWLKSGGYIIIDKTEALTVIDVNTGKYTGSLGLDETVFKTNCEAAKEIANQIRIRDIGGIIIIDFIDMKNDEYKKSLVEKLDKYFKRDKNKATVMGITNLGLVEVVRRKSKDNIDNYFKMDCITCHGEGKVKSKSTILDLIEKEIIRIKKHTVYNDAIFTVSSHIYVVLEKNNFKDIENISNFYEFKINIKENSKLDANKIDISFNN